MFQYSRIFQRHDQINSPSLPKEFIVKTVLIIFIVSIAFSALIGASVWDQHMNKAEFARGDVEALRKDEQDERQRQEEYEQWYNKPRVRSEVIVEAGSDGVDVSSFLLDREEKGYFVGDLSAVDLDTPGDYQVSVQAGPRVYSSWLRVVDTIPPKMTGRHVVVPLMSALTPDAFIESLEDATETNLSFLEKPKADVPGTQKVTVIAEDAGGNRTSLTLDVSFISIKEAITVEAGRKQPLTSEEFILGGQLPEEVRLISDLKKITFNHVSRQEVLFDWNNKALICFVDIVDTVKPSATSVPRTTYAGVSLQPSQFVTDVRDATGVKYKFVKQPVFNRIGTSDVEIDVIDEGNNRIRLRSTLTVIRDSQAPVLYGVNSFTYYRGDNRSYMQGVFARDDCDPKPVVTVDRSRVNENIPGTYTVIYTARDASGNTSSQSAQVTVKHRTPYSPKRSTGNAQLDQLCDSVLRQIVHGDMSLYEQGYQVMKWIARSLRYTSQTNRTDWIGGAIRGLSQRNGDCFIHQFTNRALLTRLGIPNYSMMNDMETHSWVMVTLGGRTFVSDAIPRYQFYGISLQEAQKRGPNGVFRWAGAREKVMKVVEVYVSIPYKVIEENDPTLQAGQSVVVREGVNGVKKETYDVEYIDNVESWRRLRESVVEREPVDKVVKIGTKVPPSPPPTTTAPSTTTPASSPLSTVTKTTPPTSETVPSSESVGSTVSSETEPSETSLPSSLPSTAETTVPTSPPPPESTASGTSISEKTGEVTQPSQEPPSSTTASAVTPP